MTKKMANTQTKRQVVEKLISDFERWLHDSNIVDLKTTAFVRLENKLTTGTIVSAIEQFALPAHKQGQLNEYVASEIKKAQLLSYKSRQAFQSEPLIQQRIDQATQRLSKYTEQEHAYIVRQLTRICQVLLM